MKFGRKWEIEINGQPYLVSQDGANLRVVFDVHVSVGNATSTADIRIYNLKKDHGIERFQSIVLKAGYVDKCDIIFSGGITNLFTERDGADIVTRLLCWSGTGHNKRGTANSPPYGDNAKVTDVLRDLAKQWPLNIQIDDEQFKNAPVMPSGYSAQGDIPKLLDALAYQYNFTWTEQLGTLVIEKNDAERQTPLYEINELTGMVGIPEVTRGPAGMGVYVTARIDPTVRVNHRINITSNFSTYNTGNAFVTPREEDLSANGIFNVFTLKYEGDTHGDAWNMSIDAMRAGTAAVNDVYDGGKLVWGAKVSQDFRNRVRKMADKQKLDPNWYMAIMAFETGQTFSPSVKNPGSSATGLIQFIESTARGLGTTTQQLKMMTAVEQLDVVEKYFDQYAGRIRSLADMYMAVLWPNAITWNADAVIFDRDGATAAQYRANSGLDKNGDGKITKYEAAERVRRAFDEGMQFAA